MVRIGIVEDDVGALVEVIRNLMVLDSTRYSFELVPVLLSDPDVDTDEANQERLFEYGVKRLQRVNCHRNGWPTIIQKGMLCPVDREQRAELLDFLKEQKVDAIICDSWLGKDTTLESKFNEKDLALAGLMLLDDAEKEIRWRGRCWIMTMYKRDVFDHLQNLLEEDGWHPENFNPLRHFLKKNLILETPPGICEDQLERIVDECWTHIGLAQTISLPAQVFADARFGLLVGRSQSMLQVYERILQYAAGDATVLILGETGVGKELVAREIHSNSRRASGRFVGIDCSTLEDLTEARLFGYVKGSYTGAERNHLGFFEEANGGVIFFDEIGNLSLPVQLKLLRVLQERKIRRIGDTRDIAFDARILAATNKDLEQEVIEGRFKGDLLQRLYVLDLEIPPLAERREDIALLCDHFIPQIAQKENPQVRRISPEALDVLQRYSWPGNVRELENRLTKAITIAGSNREVIDIDNDVITKIAALAALEQPLVDSMSVGKDDDPSQEATSPKSHDPVVARNWKLIKERKVIKNLPQWAKEIGVPQTLEIAELMINEYCHGHYPKEIETKEFFDMTYTAWKGWVNRNQKNQKKLE